MVLPESSRKSPLRHLQLSSVWSFSQAVFVIRVTPTVGRDPRYDRQLPLVLASTIVSMSAYTSTNPLDNLPNVLCFAHRSAGFVKI